jgi:imidazolonepropionase-like amidohydrolase
MALLVDAGFSPAEALRAATRNPTLFLGVGDSLGRVDSGYVADLVLLDGDPLSDIQNTRRIAGVIQAGTLLPPVALDSLRR